MTMASVRVDDEDKTMVHVAYALYAASVMAGGLPAVAAVIIGYIKRDEVKGTWLESHYRWQLRTFWFGLAWMALGFLTAILFVGLFILLAAGVWMLYRVIKGWLYLNDGKPMYAA